ncbi:hypothetical protein AAFF_G00401910, partial [Aldrovandia affinis]
MERCLFFLSLSSLLLLSTASSGYVRLKDGGSPCAGRVEVNHEGEWRTVCGAGWTESDAKLVCRELGCGTAVEVQPYPYSGSGFHKNGPYRTCSDYPYGFEVQCSGGVRLVGGAHLCDGRVEVHDGRSWQTVCDADFDQQDAEVVCRELGCGAPAEVRGAAAFGRGEGSVWSKELQCRGHESQIFFCPTSPTQKQNCSHENDVGLVCSGSGYVRLKDGGSPCAGRVEVNHGGEWRTVCGAGWTESDAKVMCRELGCGTAVELRPYPYSGSGFHKNGPYRTCSDYPYGFEVQCS